MEDIRKAVQSEGREIGLELCHPRTVLSDCTMTVSTRILLNLLVGVHGSCCPHWAHGLWPSAASVPATPSPETSVITLSRKKILLPVFSSELNALMST